jgi:hypothetical protein
MNIPNTRGSFNAGTLQVAWRFPILRPLSFAPHLPSTILSQTIEGIMDQQVPLGQQQNAPVMSMKDWIITLLISYIPLVGLIMLIVWAFDSSTNENKKNWAKASLIWMLIGIGIAIVFLVLFLGVFMSAVGSFEGQ